MMRTLSLLPVIAILCAAAIPARAADVLVVGPGEPFPTIGVAVAVAAEGDTVLVKGGTYGPFTVQGKGLSIVAEAGADVTITGGVVIVSVIAGKTVLLDRLTIRSQAPAIASLSVLFVAGSVRLQECTFLGADGDGLLVGDCDTVAGSPNATEAVRLSAAQDVAFTRCAFVGGHGSTVFDQACSSLGFAWFGGDGGAGLALISSRATVHDSELTGGDAGGSSLGGMGGFGAAASSGSTLLLVNSLVAGGNGGDSLDPFTPAEGGAGGHALSVNLGGQATLLDCSLQGGAGGIGPNGPGDAGLQVLGPGVATLWPGESKSLTVLEILREGESTPITVTGEPGELAALFVSLDTAAALVPKAKGMLHLGHPLLGPLPMGAVGAGGTVSIVAVMPQLPAGIAGLDVWLQALVSAGPVLTLSSWSHLTLLDSSL